MTRKGIRMEKKENRIKSLPEILDEYYGVNRETVPDEYLRNNWKIFRTVIPMGILEKYRIMSSQYLGFYTVMAQRPEHFQANLVFSSRVEVYLRRKQAFDALFAVPHIWGSTEGIYVLNDTPSGELTRMEMELKFLTACFFDFSMNPPVYLGHKVSLYREADNSYMSSDVYLPMDEYLLPRLESEKDMDRLAEAILETYTPETLHSGGRVSGRELAGRLGLRVHEHDVVGRDDTLGMFFIAPDKVEVLTDTKQKRQLDLRPNDILLNRRTLRDRSKKIDQTDSTLYHECSHKILDGYFYELQRMAGRTADAYAARLIISKECENRDDWVIARSERQASKLAAHLMVPRDNALRVITDIIDSQAGVWNTNTIRKAIDRLASVFNVSREMARIRMVELGYPEAEGVYRYTDNHYVKDHSCAGKWKEGVTYTISAANVLAMEDDPKAWKILTSSRYVFVDNHFCLNRSKYLYRNARGNLALTPYALSHIDECCIPFRPVGSCSCGRPQGLYAARNEKIPVEVDFTIDSDIPEDQNSEEFRKFAENLEKNANDLADLVIRMPRDYPASLRSVLERRNVSQQALADRMHMQASEVYKLLKADQEAPGPTLKQLVRACLALRLDYDESVEMIESAGRNLRANKEEVNIYRLMLKSTKILDLETCNNALMALHMKPFFDPVNG